MTLTADSKGRIACRDLFPPHASFEALKEPDGRVTLILGRTLDWSSAHARRASWDWKSGPAKVHYL